MKKVFSNHSEVCHVWASQTQEQGTAGNISFRDDSIFSYHWWEMARFYTTKSGKKYLFIRSWSYSNSTSKHLSHVRRALHGHNYETIYVHGSFSRYSSAGDCLLNHADNCQDFVNKMQNSFDKLKKSRYPRSEYDFNQSQYQELKKYCSIFRLKVPKEAKNYLLDWDNIQYLVRGAEIKEANRTYSRKRTELAERVHTRHLMQALRPEFKALIKKWRACEISTRDLYVKKEGVYWRPKGYFLRVKGEQVETTGSAFVPVREAKILLARIRAGKDIKGFKIGHYTVISINGTLKIGCHDFKRSEIEAFTNFYGW